MSKGDHKKAQYTTLKELTRVTEQARETDQRPLDLNLIRRLFGYMRPYSRIRNWLILLVVVRSIQLPAIPFFMGYIIRGPISDGNLPGVFFQTSILVAMIAFMLFIFYWRSLLGQELGEKVIHDLRNDIFAHMHSMPMRYFDTTKLGRNISRITNDAEAVRVGVQNVLFVSLVQLGQMLVAAGMMA